METAATGPLPETLSAVIQELLRGQDSAKKLRDLLRSPVDLKPLKEEEDRGGELAGLPRPPPAAEDLVGDVFLSFTSALSILNRGDSDEVSQGPRVIGSCNLVKSEESGESSKMSARRDRRGCYKRRRSSDSWTTESPNFTDDGHQWRKYGQKSILNTNFPRSYFRCTHKLDQGCQATKQVQKISNDPSLYQTIYHGQHTCQNLLKAPQIILADSSPRDSSILLSFKTEKSPNDTSARTDSNKNIALSYSPFPTLAMKREGNEVIATNCMNASHNQSSSSEYDGFPSPDFTVFGSDQGEALSSSRSFDHNTDLMMDGVDFEDVFDCPFL
ncbi:WRKY DNA-binding transcription factor 70-like [Punica granatum]|uniref:WRKY domain-containing protein n=2 Tax=Punica granatum TaxID=22663 RepID=A0A218X8S0_PUNGR|nr:WRKY DNA-binding transcription factor 70-like [Punica granatum]OWM81615.1 hypothetical protein CDL15_Pgr007653 [Punica granatum]PKI40965.1 hypothetical protein CRG98_038493 [Punica granatum]